MMKINFYYKVTSKKGVSSYVYTNIQAPKKLDDTKYNKMQETLRQSILKLYDGIAEVDLNGVEPVSKEEYVKNILNLK